MDELKKQHDEHLANKPDSMSDNEYAELLESHKENCPFCNENLLANKEPDERGDMEQTFTQADLDEAVAKAVAPIQSELDGLKATATQSEVESAVAEAKAEAEQTIADLQKELEDAALEAGNAKTELANVISYLEGEKEASELAELASAIREQRRAKIEEVANFTPEFIEANLDRWCAEDDEAFAARVDEWTASSTPKTEDAEAETASLNSVIKNVRPVTDAADKTARDLVGSVIGTKG